MCCFFGHVFLPVCIRTGWKGVRPDGANTPGRRCDTLAVFVCSRAWGYCLRDLVKFSSAAISAYSIDIDNAFFYVYLVYILSLFRGQEFFFSPESFAYTPGAIQLRTRNSTAKNDTLNMVFIPGVEIPAVIKTHCAVNAVEKMFPTKRLQSNKSTAGTVMRV